MMRSAERLLVVLIDDIDRLDSDETLAMLKIIRLNANLSRLAYVLAFDDEMVAASVEGKYVGARGAGRHFLEKIIQYPYGLPAIGHDRLVAFVMHHAQTACAVAGVTPTQPEWTVLRELIAEHFSHQLRTPRQAIRYANALRFALAIVKGQVNPFEQILVEGLRILFPGLYAAVRDDVSSFTDKRISEAILSLNRDRLRKVAAAAMNLTEETRDVRSGIAVVEALFSDKERPKSIARTRYFDLYFSYSLGPGQFTDEHLYDVIRNAWDDTDLSSSFTQLAESSPIRLLDALSTLRPRLRPDFSAIAARAVARSGELFVEHKSEISSLIGDFVQDVPREGDIRQSVVIDVLTIIQPHELFVSLLGYDYVWEKDFTDEGSTESNAALDRYREILSQRIRQLAEVDPKKMISEADDRRSLLQKWNWAGATDQRAWLEAQIICFPTGAIDLLGQVLAEDRGPWSLSRSNLRRFVSQEALEDGVKAYASEQRARRDTEIIYIGRAQYKLQEALDLIRKLFSDD